MEDPFHGTAINRAFLRVKVLINTNNSLVTGFWLQRNSLPKIWVYIRYEKLMDFCFNCGRLGHDQKMCKNKRALDTTNPGKSTYGPWLGVPPVKKITTPAIVVNGTQNRMKEKSLQGAVSDQDTSKKDENGKSFSTSRMGEESIEDLPENRREDIIERRRQKAKENANTDREMQSPKSNLEPSEMQKDGSYIKYSHQSQKGETLGLTENRNSSIAHATMPSPTAHTKDSKKAQWIHVTQQQPKPKPQEVSQLNEQQTTTKPNKQNNEKIGQLLQVWQPPPQNKKEEKAPIYFVEFLDEEHEEHPEERSNPIETFLTREIKMKLNLKRSRIDAGLLLLNQRDNDTEDSSDNPDPNPTSSKKSKENNSYEVNTFPDMAEEAGPTKPYQSP